MDQEYLTPSVETGGSNLNTRHVTEIGIQSNLDITSTKTELFKIIK